MKRTTTLSLLIAILFAGNTAQAEVVTSAWLGSVSIQLIDLNSEDGIAPSITLIKNKFSTDYDMSGNAYAYDSSVDNTSSYSYSNSFPLSSNVSTAVSKASSSITGSDPSNGSQNADGSARGIGGASFGNYSASTSVSSSFYLSPFTQVIFSVLATTSASSNAPYSTGPEYGSASANIYTGRMSWFDSPVQDSIESYSYSYALGNIDDNKSRMLSVSLTNPFNEAISAYFTARTGVRGESYSDYAPLSTVPAPAALPLMLSALGIFSFASRRRKDDAPI